MSEGLNNLYLYMFEGKLPPLAWCPFTDIAWFNMHFWGGNMATLAYVLFPLCLLRIAHFAPSRADLLPPDWVIVMIGMFVVTCGIGHQLDHWAMFSGAYNFKAFWVLVTGTASMVTNVGLWLHGSDLKNNGRFSPQTL